MKLTPEEKEAIKMSRDNNRVKETYLGKWGFITGSQRISETVFNRSFPQGIFGRVIDVNRGIMTMRCRRKRFGKIIKCKFKTTEKYFKVWE